MRTLFIILGLGNLLIAATTGLVGNLAVGSSMAVVGLLWAGSDDAEDDDQE